MYVLWCMIWIIRVELQFVSQSDYIPFYKFIVSNMVTHGPPFTNMV